MMQVQCIRHGESAANAGEVTTDPTLIPLTTRGWQQALAFSEQLITAPGLVICSPFLRAMQTAEPTLKRFPEVSAEVWPIQEFTYLSPVRFADTTRLERLPWVQAYWDAADPDLIDGDGAESFAAMFARAQDCLARLEQLQKVGYRSICMFGHGQFFQALRWVILDGVRAIDASAMHAFRSMDMTAPIHNTEGFVARLQHGAWSIRAD